MQSAEAERYIANEMRLKGLDAGNYVILDGSIHRFSTKKKHSKSGWYVFFFEKGRVYGSYGCWHSGEKHTIRGDISRQEESVVQRRAVNRGRTEGDRARLAKKVAQQYRSGLAECCAWNENSYVRKKGLKTMHCQPICMSFDYLQVPLYDIKTLLCSTTLTPEFRSIQTIMHDRKRFWFGLSKKDSVFVVNKPYRTPLTNTVILAEGLATALSVAHTIPMDASVLMCCDAWNMVTVAQKIHEHGGRQIVVAADDDPAGLKAAFQIKKTCQAYIMVPNSHQETESSDFNDILLELGEAELRRQMSTHVDNIKDSRK